MSNTAHMVARPMETAPRDATLVRLKVEYDRNEQDANPLEDVQVGWTIGFNQYQHTGEDEWFMAGWDWDNDEFISGKGRPIGWRPFYEEPSLLQPTDGMVEAAARSDAEFDGRTFDALGRADKQRYLDRARAALTVALKVMRYQL